MAELIDNGTHQKTRDWKRGERGEKGISLLPGRGPSQQLEAWLRVPEEDDVFGRAKCLVADDHLDFEGKPGTYSEESLGVRVGQFLIGDHEGIRVEDHQGEEVTNEVFSQAWMASKSMSHCH